MRQQIRDLQNNTEILGGAMDRVIKLAQSTQTLAMGVLETIKLMPGYAEAINELQERQKQQADGQEQGNTE